jgi:pyruvate formate lyase activating enzyme
MTVEDLVEEVLRDRVFYMESGGGVTFSGGEPMRQPEFVLACLAELKRHGVHTAVDTCGLADEDALMKAADLADLFLFDIKHADEAAHAEWAGAPNDRILANLRMLAAAHGAVWVRVPVVPGVNDDEVNLRHTAALAASLPGVQRVSLLPYHELGTDKRKRAGMAGEPFQATAPHEGRMRDIATIFEAAGLHTVIGG